MVLDERYLPIKNNRLNSILREAGFQGTTPKEVPWGAFFGMGADLFVILNAKTGTTVHDHPKHKGGTLRYLGPIVDTDADFKDTLAYKCQVNRNQERVADQNDVVVTLSPGENINLIYGSGVHNRGIVGRFYGCHNLSDYPVALSIAPP